MSRIQSSSFTYSGISSVLAMIETNKPGGVKGRSQPDFIELQAIPLPSLEQQVEIITELARRFAVCEGANMIGQNWTIDRSFFNGIETPLSEMADIGSGSTPSRTNSAYFGGDVKWVLTAEVDENEITTTAETLTEEAIKDYGLRVYPPDTILVAMYGARCEYAANRALFRVPAGITQNCGGIVINRPDVLPRYVYYYLRSIYEIIRGQEYSGGGVPHLNLTIVGNVRVPIPSIEEQQRVVAKVDAKLKLLTEVRSLKEETECSIEQILNRIWGS